MSDVVDPIQSASGLAVNDVSSSEFDLEAINELPEFDVAAYLDSAETIAAYLNDFLEEGDAAMIAHALGTAARARGMSDVAKEAGMARESLYKALRPESSPRLETVMKVMKVFGLRLVVQPIQQQTRDPKDTEHTHT
jgi:probable addiction module antidote protein